MSRNIRLLYAFWFLRDFQLWIPVWIVFLTVEQGFSLTAVTSAEGLYLVAVVLLEIPTGAVADRWGRSRSLALGAVFLGVSVLIFAFAGSFSVLLASFLLWSLAHTLMSGADMALLYDTLKEGGRLGDYERLASRGTALLWVGIGVATFLGGPVAAVVGIRATIFVGAATCALTALVALSIHEPPRAAPAAREAYFASIRSAIREAWASPAVRAVILLTGTAIAALESLHYLIQPYLLDRGVEVGPMFSMLQVPMIMAGIGGSLLAARVRGRAVLLALVVVPALGGLTYFALAMGPGLSAYAAFPLMFVFASCLVPLASGYINRRIDSERRATVLSVQGMVMALTMAMLAATFGFVTDTWGIALTFTIGGALALLTVVIFGPMILTTRTAGNTPALGAPADA
jgi:predicted MFS family arabinose efflux permease